MYQCGIDKYFSWCSGRLGAGTLIVVSPQSPRVRCGIVAGTKALFERTLELETPLQSRNSARALSMGPQRLDSLSLLQSMYSLIELNWDRSANRDDELWRWIVRPQLNARNPSPERTLEKAIIEDTAEWVNQIPAASGLVQRCPDCSHDERHMNVDLARRCGPNWFELVELKAGLFADTPLWGAFEILRYGLLYCFARAHRSDLYMPKAQVLMKAERIDLKVLATEEVYAGYNLAWLAESLDEGLREFSQRKFFGALTFRFQFEAFPHNFRWPEDRPRLTQMLAGRSRYTFRHPPVRSAVPIYAAGPGIPLYGALPLHRESA